MTIADFGLLLSVMRPALIFETSKWLAYSSTDTANKIFPLCLSLVFSRYHMPTDWYQGKLHSWIEVFQHGYADDWLGLRLTNILVTFSGCSLCFSPDIRIVLEATGSTIHHLSPPMPKSWKQFYQSRSAGSVRIEVQLTWFSRHAKYKRSALNIGKTCTRSSLI